MKHQSLCCFISLLLCQAVHAKVPSYCSHSPAPLKPICKGPYLAWQEGRNDLYVTGYAWHNRYTYPPEKWGTYNELAWGGGLGKSTYDEHGDWHGVYAFAFLESHSKVEPIGGYAFLKTFHINETSNIGLGFTAFITARPDILNGYPFPGALPWAGLTYRRATFIAIYIPGARGAGNVLFMIGKYTFS